MPALVVFHTPPDDTPMYHVCLFSGMHRDGADAARRDRGPDRAQAEVLERGLDEWILIAATGGRLCRFLSRDGKRRRAACWQGAVSS